MHLFEFSEASAFLARSKNFLSADESANHLLLTGAEALVRARTPRSPKLQFFIVEEAGKPVCAALNATDRRLLLSGSTAEAAAFLAETLSERQICVRGVFGPRVASDSFSEIFVQQRQATQQLMYSDRMTEENRAAGKMRLAERGDLPTLIRWSVNMAEECGIDETPQESEEIVFRRLDEGKLFVWEDEGPVSMASHFGYRPEAARIQMVYTDQARRGYGYGGSLVRQLCRRLLADGHAGCLLFADAGNAAVIRLYERLGFQTLGEFTEASFSGSKVKTTG